MLAIIKMSNTYMASHSYYSPFTFVYLIMKTELSKYASLRSFTKANC